MFKKDFSIHFLFGSLFIIAILNGYFFNWINNSFFHFKSNGNELKEFNAIERFAIIVIITPIVETYLFQYLPNIVMTKFKISNKVLLILIPSIIFGCIHYYFWLYAAMAFIGGILINLLYVNIKIKSRYYFLIVSLFHSLYNMYGFLFIN